MFSLTSMQIGSATQCFHQEFFVLELRTHLVALRLECASIIEMLSEFSFLLLRELYLCS